ncbi:hypothetical protein APHAL10511_003656 [Amanita phalloides]|nr:hypothetical protein APHAL10511_003656 [Amanita phalloides]
MDSSSSSTPSSSSESGYESRTSTPLLDSSTPGELLGISLPRFFVHLPCSQADPKDLNAIFSECAIGGLLVLYLPSIIDDVSCPVGDKLTWTAKNVSTDGRNIDYHLGISSDGLDLSQLETIPSIDRVQASHLFLLATASLRSIASFWIQQGRWVLHILEKPFFVFPPLSAAPSFSPGPNGLSGSKGNIPTLEEWRNLWSAWDLVTLEMIPQTMLHKKPIELRHKCLFYVGHIPTFLDMLLSKAIGGEPSEPRRFWDVFERGIDPHVDDPSRCHRHSDVPENDDDWPMLESVLVFRDRVRARLVRLYNELEAGTRPLTRNIGRMLVMTIEHESFHIETLLYMLIQCAGTGTLPPPNFTPPPWGLLVQHWANIPAPIEPTVIIKPNIITLGHDDCEGYDGIEDVKFAVHGHTFGWDNESPARSVAVGRFEVEWRPITNGEFESFWRMRENVPFPKSWCLENGEVKIRTIHGPVSMEVARNWAVLTSYDDLALYAQFKGGRLPTEPELRLFLDLYDVGYEGGANVGFRHWHAMPLVSGSLDLTHVLTIGRRATTGLTEYEGRGSNGGIWEWTSTVFDAHDGLFPTRLFTGYSTDFFDSKHHVVLGGSYATVPRLASRRTLRNFYQHNYPYAWVGARVVYDV